MVSPAPIRTPWIQHWRRIRYQLMPVLIFAGSVVLTAWLWGRHITLPNAVGEVSAVRVNAVSPIDGMLVERSEKPVELFDAVQAGEVLIRMDDRPAMASLATLQGDLARLGKDVEATGASLAEQRSIRVRDDMAEARRLTLDIERLRLDVLDRKALIETDQIELSRLNEKYQAIKALFDRGVESRLILVDVELQRDVVRQRIEGNQKCLEEAVAQKQACAERLAKYTGTELADLQTLLSPLRAAIATQEARIRELRLQVQLLEIRSPISGTVAAIYCYPGQSVRIGTPVMLIAATQGQYILSYIRQDQRIRPAVGMSVDVRARILPRSTVRARIERVGPQIEPVPQHQLRDPKIPEWGQPVQIAMPKGLDLRPGELVDLAFTPPPPEEGAE